MKNLKKKTAAEEEIKEETSVEAPETEEIKETVEEVETTEEKPETEEGEGEKITLDSGAIVDESAHPEAEEAESLVTITKEDGTEIFVEKVESEDEAEKKEIYEAIVEADSNETEEVSEEVLKELDNEEIDEVNYIPAACKTHFASLNNSFYVVKTKAGKIKAFKAGKILDSKTKSDLLSKIKAGKKTENEVTVFSKIASKIGTKLSSFIKLASKKIAKKHMPVVGDTLTDSKTGKEVKVIASKKMKSGTKLVLNNGSIVDAKKLQAAEASADDKKQLEVFNVDTDKLPQSKIETAMNIDEKALETEDVKSAKSKVKNYFGKLPNKSGTGTDVEWYLKDFSQARNKTVASQVKALRDVTKALHEAKEVIASKDETIKQLQAKLDTIENQKKVMLKNQKISKITASMNLTEAEDIRCATKRLASYSDEQLDAIYETINLSSSLITDLVHEQEANEQMKKEASMNSYIPGIALSDSYGSDNKEIDYVELLKQKELNK
ncbi:MAG: hypothetical protein NC222_06190 [Staphylococcus sp.]|nr:hypothetical protein [Staphylococcus sp.]